MSFSMETEIQKKVSFLDVDVIREHKPAFSGVYSNFESFLPVHKFGMVYTLVY